MSRFNVLILFCLVIITSGCADKAQYATIPQPASIHDKPKISYANFSGLNMEKADLKLQFEGKDLPLELPIYIELNRNYIPLTEIVNKLDGDITTEQNITKITLNGINATIDLQHNTYSKVKLNDQKLRKKAIIRDEYVYLSLYDFSRIFDLKTRWNINGKTISLFWNRNKPTPKSPSNGSQQALLRLEDVSAGHLYGTEEAAEKLRVVTDYLYAENIPFHVAWVPRYIDPRPDTKLDNDLTKTNSMLNADFLFTLDYMLDRNGLIGLHGYTHQYGNTESIGGVEFHTSQGDGIPSTKEYVQERLKLMRQNSETLNLPYTFFEAPHYAISQNDLKQVEEYFDFIFQRYPGEYSKVVEKKVGTRSIKYIPTPLDYIDGKSDTKRMLGKIQNLRPNALASLFYHPYIEFDDITLTQQPDGYPQYTYSEDSVLHQVSKALRNKGYKFVTIKDI